MYEHPGYNDIVPDPVQNELMQWGTEIDQHRWDVGQRANELTAEWDNKLSRYQVCEAVAFFLGDVGGTVRDWERIYRKTPYTIRVEYDHLKISHFRLCIPYCKTMDDWRRILDTWLSEASTLSVSSLAKFLNDSNDKGVSYYKLLGSVEGRIEQVLNHEHASIKLQEACRDFLLVIGDELEFTREPELSSIGEG